MKTNFCKMKFKLSYFVPSLPQLIEWVSNQNVKLTLNKVPWKSILIIVFRVMNYFYYWFRFLMEVIFINLMHFLISLDFISDSDVFSHKILLQGFFFKTEYCSIGHSYSWCNRNANLLLKRTLVLVLMDGLQQLFWSEEL